MRRIVAPARGCRFPFGRASGQAAMETMLILPFFLTYLVLMINFGLLMYEYVTVANATREGARLAATGCAFSEGTPPVLRFQCDATKIKDRTVEATGRIIQTSDVSVCWKDRSNPENFRNYDQGDSVVVTVNHPFRFLMLPSSLTPDLPVFSVSDMRLERTDENQSLPVCAS